VAPARRRISARRTKRTVSALPLYSMVSPSPSMYSSTPSRFWRKKARLPGSANMVPDWLPAASCRTSRRAPRMTMVPLVTTTLPVNVDNCFWSS